MAYYIDTFPGREITIKGKPFLYFGGTAYLGLQTDISFQELFIANLRTYGTNYGASRKSNVRISIFGEAEAFLTRLVGSEGCTTLSSGYLAGQFVMQHFNRPEFQLFYAPNTHSAMFGTKVKTYKTYTDLNTALRAHISAQKNSVPVVFLDSIDFSGGNYPDFIGLKSLPLDQLILVIDDSHGIGVVGGDGGGIFRTIAALRPRELVVCCSLGKGFAVQAGAVFGNKTRIGQLTDSEFFGGASPASPAAMATLVQAQNHYVEKRKILHRNIKLFLDQTHGARNFHWMPGHPTFSYGNPPLTVRLEDKGIIVTDFSYPNEEGENMSRIVLSAAHCEADIFALTTVVNS